MTLSYGRSSAVQWKSPILDAGAIGLTQPADLFVVPSIEDAYPDVVPSSTAKAYAPARQTKSS